MNCPDKVCRLVTCPVTDDIESYLGDFSLQTGFTYSNLEISVGAPVGGFYIAPAGSIVITVPPNPDVISYQGCSSTITSPVPPGSSQSAIAAIVADIMNQAATQQAGCNAAHTPPIFGFDFIQGSYQNQVVTVGCPDGLMMNLTGSLPPGVSFSITGLSVVAGMFSSSISQEDADNSADDYLTEILLDLVECGYWNTEQTITCSDGTTTETTPADKYFSTVSQDDADQQAKDAAEAMCPPPIYWNTEQKFTCPDSTVETVPAHTYSSMISQEDADSIALAAAEAMCPAIGTCQDAIDNLVWTVSQTNPANGKADPAGITYSAVGGVVSFSVDAATKTQGGYIQFDAILTNTSDSDCTYEWSSPDKSAVVTISTCTGSTFPTALIAVTPGATPLERDQYQTSDCTHHRTTMGFAPFTVAAGHSQALQIFANAYAGSPSGAATSTANASGTFTLSVVP